ncbi:MAG TPA: hypothetical protein VG347_23665 [Verrucomicrobiae bacterium]|nr:hypothetical protein [Verrucomicrobiae bacterium]
MISNDATQSTKGTVYQLCVAVQKCFEMLAGQKVFLESEGDVTIANTEQVETKLYSDRLTDGHKNLWNTLRNWMQPGFDEGLYASLILYTTQQFGEKATIAQWNDCSADERIKILDAIHANFEKRFEAEQKESGATPKPSEVLSLQRIVLEQKNRDKLKRIAAKFVIEASSATLPDLHSLIKDRFIKGILNGKKDDFLNALIGYVAQPGATKNQKWEITFDQFDKKVGDLTSAYCRETRSFPSKCFQGTNPLPANQLKQHQEHNFVLKIKEIEHHAVIAEAIRDYLGAMQTLNEELSKYEVPASRGERYAQDILTLFTKRYRVACSKCKDQKIDSQNFFDEHTASPPNDFEGFTHTPFGFRNGVIHIQMEDAPKNLKWKLEPNE